MARYNDFGGKGALSGRKRRFAAPSAVAITMGLAAFAGMAEHPARADDSSQQLQLLEDQIRQLQAQIDSLKKTQTQQAQQTPPAQAAAIGNNKPAYGYQTGSHQFGWASADGQDSIELTGRLNLDVGDYLSYSPQGGQGTKHLDSGFNARRARIGVTGKFAGDFNYTLIFEAGGSSDAYNSGISGSTASGVENAFITYNGFNKPTKTVPAAFDIGYLDVPFTLDEATSANDTMFMERSSAQVVATAFGGGDNRSAFGVRSYKSNYWAGVYVTGPTSGTGHYYAASPGVEEDEALSFLGRVTYNPYQDDDSSIHLGLNYGHLVKTGSASGTPALGQVLSLSDRPELRVDPTALLSTGNITHVTGGNVYGAEAAAAYQQFFAQGEFYRYDVTAPAQTYGAGAFTVTGTESNPSFYGGYGEASYSIGGKRHYNPSTGAYTGVIPTNPLSFSGGGWGALEFALRYSRVDLDDIQAGVQGGDQTTYGVGINYYPNTNIRVMLDYLHTDLSKDLTTAAGTSGADINAIAARFQVVF